MIFFCLFSLNSRHFDSSLKVHDENILNENKSLPYVSFIIIAKMNYEALLCIVA